MPYPVLTEKILELKSNGYDVPDELPDSKYYDYWEKIIIDCRFSGMGDAEWCKQNHISTTEFFAGIGAVWRIGKDIPDRTQKPNTKEEWRDEVRSCIASGIADRDWCVLNGISIIEFRRVAQNMRKDGIIPKLSNHEWLYLIKECNESGQTQEEWCAENSIPIHIYKNAVHRLNLQGFNVRKRVPCRSLDEWFELYKLWKQSQLTQKELCKKAGVSKQSFYMALKRLKAAGYNLKSYSGCESSYDACAEEPVNTAPGALCAVKTYKSANLSENTVGLATEEKVSLRSQLEMVKKCHASGLSDAEWCMDNSISHEKLRQAIRNLKARSYDIPENKRTVPQPNDVEKNDIEMDEAKDMPRDRIRQTKRCLSALGAIEGENAKTMDINDANVRTNLEEDVEMDVVTEDAEIDVGMEMKDISFSGTGTMSIADTPVATIRANGFSIDLYNEVSIDTFINLFVALQKVNQDKIDSI